MSNVSGSPGTSACLGSYRQPRAPDTPSRNSENLYHLPANRRKDAPILESPHGPSLGPVCIDTSISHKNFTEGWEGNIPGIPGGRWLCGRTTVPVDRPNYCSIAGCGFALSSGPDRTRISYSTAATQARGGESFSEFL